MESEVTFQLFADKVCLLLAKVCQGTQILHNFEKFVDLPQNRKFLTFFRFDAHVFPFTKECYVLFLLGRTEKRKERGTRTIATRNAAFSLSTRFTRVGVSQSGKGRGIFRLVLVYYQQITGETNSEHERMVGPRVTRRSGLSFIISFITPQSPLPKSLHNISILQVRRASSMESRSLRT